MNIKNLHLVFLGFVVLQSTSSFAADPAPRTLIAIDIDNTLGIQSKEWPEFSDGTIATIESDSFGDFYYYLGAIDFIKTVHDWKTKAHACNNDIDIALFTMGSGPRNEIIRDYIETKLNLTPGTIAVFDYSNAVFSEDLIAMWQSSDPKLSPSMKEYLDSLDKKIVHTAKMEGRQTYYKDLSKLLPFYPGLTLERIRLVDDNAIAVPTLQTHQLITAEPQAQSGYKTILQKLESFVEVTSCQ